MERVPEFFKTQRTTVEGRKESVRDGGTSIHYCLQSGSGTNG